MKTINRILSVAGAAALGLFAAGCTPEVDNAYSRFPSVVEMTASAEELILNEDTPDEVALTITWTQATDHGDSYFTTYTYTYDLSEKTNAVSEEEYDGIFVREYTHSELQDMLIDHFGYTTSTWGTLIFSVSADFEGSEGDPVVLPDQDRVTVRVKTYGAKQFAADRIYIAGTAIGAEAVELSPSANNASLYVYEGDLAVGQFNYPVEYGDENNVIIPASGSNTALASGETGAATIVGNDETLAYWVVEEADSYRVTLNMADHSVSYMKTADIVEIDRILMSGSAAVEGTEIAQTLENASLYAWKGELSAGTLQFPIEFGGETNLTMVPEGDSHSFVDGAAGNAYTSVRSNQARESYWEITAAGTYRIVIDTDARKVAIYSEATDMKNKTVLFKRTSGEANDNCSEEVTQLWIFGSNKYYSGSKPAGEPYVLKQSMANPRLFVYKGETLTNDIIKFLTSDNWNNEYAFGASDTRDAHATPTLGQAFTPLYGGQGNNRYAMFNIPEGTNYIEVYIGSERYDENAHALSNCWSFPDSYVLFDQR